MNLVNESKTQFKSNFQNNFMTVVTEGGITITTTTSKIELDKLSKSDFQKPGTLTAQIRQLVKTVSLYPAKKTTSDKQNNIFSNEDFGFGGQTFESIETRVAWLLVPETTTEAAE